MEKGAHAGENMGNEITKQNKQTTIKKHHVKSVSNIINYIIVSCLCGVSEK